MSKASWVKKVHTLYLLAKGFTISGKTQYLSELTFKTLTEILQNGFQHVQQLSLEANLDSFDSLKKLEDTLAHFKDLKELRISLASKKQDNLDFLLPAGHLTKLSHLTVDLTPYEITPTIISFLKNINFLSNLESLEIKVPTFKKNRWTENILETIKPTEKLKFLKIRHDLFQNRNGNFIRIN